MRVLGEEGIYYKIEPPKMVFFYAPVKGLSKGREVRVIDAPGAWRVEDVPEPADPAPDPEPAVVEESGPALPLPPAPPVELADAPEVTATPEAPLPAGEPGRAAEVAEVPPAEILTPPSSPLAGEFERLDAEYAEAVELPLGEQPLEELRARYADLLARAAAAVEAGDAGATAVVPVAEARLETIDVRRQALSDLREVRRLREDLAERQQALAAERQELAERAERGQVVVYDAVGELQASSLQTRGAQLFRLCDPETKRTVVYLRAGGDAAARLAGQLGRFVGVTGELVRDRELDLSYVAVDESAPVAAEDVFGRVAAKLVPPSMVPTADDDARTASAR